MKTSEYVKQHQTYDLGYSMSNQRVSGFILAQHVKEIDEFGEAFPDKELTISYTGIELSHATREELIAFLTAFGGDWDKKVADYYPDKMTYEQEFSVGDLKYTIKASNVPPPPSCKIVEEEVVVPEHKEMKKKIVCKEPAQDPVEELQAAHDAEQGPQV
jgi:hypothetical protein